MLSIRKIINNSAGSISIQDLEILVAFVLGKDKCFIFAHDDYELNKKQLSKLSSLVKRRLAGEPIAYLVGHKEFYGLDFVVNKDVLVPRPETEMMIENVLSIIKDGERYNIIDIGTGSGCIICTIANQVQSSKFKVQNCLGIDISEKALRVAKKNAKFLKVEKTVKFINSNLLEKVDIKKLEIGNWKLIICANLPYLTPEQVKRSPSIRKEPRLALVAGKDGLKYYRNLFKQLSQLVIARSGATKQSNRVRDCRASLRCAHNDVMILCEIDPSQNKSIVDLFKKFFPDGKYEVKKDLAGLDRLFIGKL